VQRFRAVVTRPNDDEWTVTVPDIGQATITDPGLADFECRQLLQRHLALEWSAVDDLDVTLVDSEGEPVYAFDLLFTSLSRHGSGANSVPLAALMADPPPGCRFVDFGGIPGLQCVRRGPSRLATIAALIAEVRDRYGVEADDLGFEKLWEWAGSREWRERMVAHLLLMATHRARLIGVPAEDLLAFVRTAMG
jgi:hypothetical protein